MPNNDIEAFEYVISDPETAVEIDYLTYAMFAHREKHWIDHYKQQNNDQLPDQAHIDVWIGQLTDYDFQQMRSEAADFFHFSAELHLEDYIESQKKQAVDNSILGEIKSYTSRGNTSELLC